MLSVVSRRMAVAGISARRMLLAPLSLTAMTPLSSPTSFTKPSSGQPHWMSISKQMMSSSREEVCKDSELHVNEDTLEFEDVADLHLSTRDAIHGRETVKELGVVIGTSARARNFIEDIIQRIRGVLGGSLLDYEELFANATAEATHKAMIEAKKLGATAIVRTRYESAATDSKLSGVSCFVICYGTAVVDRKIASGSSSNYTKPAQKTK